jgi:hypothetical protein
MAVRRLVIVGVSIVTIGLSACGTETSATGATGGSGDTTQNAEDPLSGTSSAGQWCGWDVYDGSTLIAYESISSSSAADCSASNLALTPASTLPVVSGSATCWTTTADGTSTTRVYQAPNTDGSEVQRVCTNILQDSGLSG